MNIFYFTKNDKLGIHVVENIQKHMERLRTVAKSVFRGLECLKGKMICFHLTLRWSQ